MLTIAITTGKGGVGKTTLTYNLGHLLAEKYRVLMVDCDPQASLTTACNLLQPSTTLANVITHATPQKEIANSVYQISPNLALIPSSLQLQPIETFIANKTLGELILKRALTAIASNFDYCLLDAPPNLGKLGISILTASDTVIAPLIPDILSISAIGALLTTIDEVKSSVNENLKIMGIVITQFSEQAKHHQAAVEAIKGAGVPVFNTTIGKTIKFAEAMAEHQPLHIFDPKNSRTSEMKALIKEIHQWQIKERN